MNTNKIMREQGKRYARILSAVMYKTLKLGDKDLRIEPVGVGPFWLTLGIKLNNPVHLPKVLSMSESAALGLRSGHVMAIRDKGLILYQIQLPSTYWTDITRDDLTNYPNQVIGLGEGQSGIEFNLTDAPHSLIAAATQSGKTIAAISGLVGLAKEYEPDKLGVVICDPNKEFSDFNNLAHLLMPIAYEADEIQTAFTFVNNELAYRKAENIKDGKSILFICDEASDAACFGERKTVNKPNLAMGQVICKQGAKYQIHMSVISQKPSHDNLPGILDNLLNRFIGQVSDAQTSYLLAGKAGLQAHLLTGKGDFIHAYGPNSSRFQVAMATAKDFESLPRAEIKASVVSEDIIDLPDDEPEKPKAGRKALSLEPVTMAYVLYHYSNLPTIRQARDNGISYEKYKLHTEFVKNNIKFIKDVMTELKRLRGE